MKTREEELEQIVHDGEIIEKGKTIFSLKWVEKVMFWVIVAFAAAIVGSLINFYIIQGLVPTP
jgi:hypothetical protein